MENEEESLFTSEYTNEYIEKIEKTFENIPDKRKKKDYQKWKDEANRLITECNKLAKYTIYKPIK